jgi:hypothetical protein
MSATADITGATPEPLAVNELALDELLAAVSYLRKLGLEVPGYELGEVDPAIVRQVLAVLQADVAVKKAAAAITRQIRRDHDVIHDGEQVWEANPITGLAAAYDRAMDRRYQAWSLLEATVVTQTH